MALDKRMLLNLDAPIFVSAEVHGVERIREKYSYSRYQNTKHMSISRNSSK
jgi:hypothetical protein